MNHSASLSGSHYKTTRQLPKKPTKYEQSKRALSSQKRSPETLTKLSHDNSIESRHMIRSGQSTRIITHMHEGDNRLLSSFVVDPSKQNITLEGYGSLMDSQHWYAAHKEVAGGRVNIEGRDEKGLLIGFDGLDYKWASLIKSSKKAWPMGIVQLDNKSMIVVGTRGESGDRVSFVSHIKAEASGFEWIREIKNTRSGHEVALFDVAVLENGLIAAVGSTGDYGDNELYYILMDGPEVICQKRVENEIHDSNSNPALSVTAFNDGFVFTGWINGRGSNLGGNEAPLIHVSSTCEEVWTEKLDGENNNAHLLITDKDRLYVFTKDTENSIGKPVLAAIGKNGSLVGKARFDHEKTSDASALMYETDNSIEMALSLEENGKELITYNRFDVDDLLKLNINCSHWVSSTIEHEAYNPEINDVDHEVTDAINSWELVNYTSELAISQYTLNQESLCYQPGYSSISTGSSVSGEEASTVAAFLNRSTVVSQNASFGSTMATTAWQSSEDSRETSPFFSLEDWQSTVNFFNETSKRSATPTLKPSTVASIKPSTLQNNAFSTGTNKTSLANKLSPTTDASEATETMLQHDSTVTAIESSAFSTAESTGLTHSSSLRQAYSFTRAIQTEPLEANTGEVSPSPVFVSFSSSTEASSTATNTAINTDNSDSGYFDGVHGWSILIGASVAVAVVLIIVIIVMRCTRNRARVQNLAQVQPTARPQQFRMASVVTGPPSKI